MSGGGIIAGLKARARTAGGNLLLRLADAALTRVERYRETRVDAAGDVSITDVVAPLDSALPQLGEHELSLGDTTLDFTGSVHAEDGGKIGKAEHSVTKEELAAAVADLEAGRESIMGRLAALDPSRVDVAELEARAQFLKRFEDVVIVAPRGSGIEAACNALLDMRHNEVEKRDRDGLLRKGKGGPRILFANPDNLDDLLGIIDPKETGIVYVTDALEEANQATQHCFRRLAQYIEENGEKVRRHTVTITHRTSVVGKELDRRGVGYVDVPALDGQPLGSDSYFFHAALIPLFLSGVNINEMITAAQERLQSYNAPAGAHPIWTKIALIKALAEKGHYQQSIIVYRQAYEEFCAWQASQLGSAIGQGSENAPIIQTGVGPGHHHRARQQEMEGENHMVVHTVHVPSTAGTDIDLSDCPEALFNGLTGDQFFEINAEANDEALERNNRPVLTETRAAHSPATYAQMVMDVFMMRESLREVYGQVEAQATQAAKKQERTITTGQGITLRYGGAVGEGALGEEALGFAMVDALQAVAVERSQTEAPDQEATAWMRAIDETLDELDEVRALADKMMEREEFWDVGIGGQSAPAIGVLAALLHSFNNLIDKDKRVGGGSKVRFMESPDSLTVSQLLAGIDLTDNSQVAVLINSLSGGTPETLINFGILLANGLGRKGAAVATAINLEVLFKDAVDNQGFPHMNLDPTVGGRFTAYTKWMALILMVAGLDAKAYLKGARAYRDNTHPKFDESERDALSNKFAEFNTLIEDLSKPDLDDAVRREKTDRLSALSGEISAYKSDEQKKSILERLKQSPGDIEAVLLHNLNTGVAQPRTVRTTIFTHDGMAQGTGLDHNQLWNESAGREGREFVTVTMGMEEAEQSMSALVADRKRVFTLVHVKNTGKTEADRLRQARFGAMEKRLQEAGQPYVVYELDTLDEATLGAFRFAQTDSVCSFVYLSNIRERKSNSPYGQPGVEAGKLGTRLKVGKLKGHGETGSTLPLAEPVFDLVDVFKGVIQDPAYVRKPAERREAAINAVISALENDERIGDLYVYVAGEEEARVQKSGDERHTVVLNILPHADLMDAEDGLVTSTITVFKGKPKPGNYKATYTFMHGGMDTTLVSGVEPGMNYARTLEFIKLQSEWRYRLRGASDVPLIVLKPGGSQLAVSDAVNTMPGALKDAVMSEADREKVKFRNREDVMAVYEETQIRGGVAVCAMTPLEILNMQHYTSSTLGRMYVVTDRGVESFDDFVEQTANGHVDKPELFWVGDQSRYWVIFGNENPTERVKEKIEAEMSPGGAPIILAQRRDRIFASPFLPQELQGISWSDFVSGHAGFNAEQQPVLQAFLGALKEIREILPLGGLEMPAGVMNRSGDVQEWVDWETEIALTMAYYAAGSEEKRREIERAMADKNYPIRPIEDALLAFHIGEEQLRVLTGNLDLSVVAAFDSADGTSTGAANESLGTFMTLYELPEEVRRGLSAIPGLDSDPIALHNTLTNIRARDMARIAVMALHGPHPSIYLANTAEQGIFEFRLAGAGSNDFVLVDRLESVDAMVASGRITPEQLLRIPEAMYSYPGTSTRPGGRLRVFYELYMAAMLSEAVGNQGSDLTTGNMLDATPGQATMGKGKKGFAHSTMPVAAGSPRIVSAFERVALEGNGVVPAVIADLRNSRTRNVGPLLAIGGEPRHLTPSGLYDLLKYFVNEEDASFAWSGSGAVDIVRTVRPQIIRP
ncbi:MAG: hypothetical protein ABH823_05330 [bacterium]